MEKAVSILPDDATLNDHLGDAYWKSNRRDEAVSQWKRVLILDPNFGEKKIDSKKKLKKVFNLYELHIKKIVSCKNKFIS